MQTELRKILTKAMNGEDGWMCESQYMGLVFYKETNEELKFIHVSEPHFTFLIVPLYFRGRADFYVKRKGPSQRPLSYPSALLGDHGEEVGFIYLNRDEARKAKAIEKDNLRKRKEELKADAIAKASRFINGELANG